MKRFHFLCSAAAAVLLPYARSSIASELIYGFNDSSLNGFNLAYDGSDNSNSSLSESTTTGVTEGAGAMNFFVGGASGYDQVDAFTSTIPADLILPATTSLNLDLTLNTGAVGYAFLLPVFFVEGGSYLGGANVDKKLLPASSANIQLAGNTYNGSTLTYNLQAYKDPYASTDGDSSTALYTPGQIAAAVNETSPTSLAQITTFGLEVQCGANSGLNYYIDNITIPSASAGSTWNLNGSGDWNTSANWSGNIPDAIGAVANFGSVITSGATVTSAIPIMAGTLNFNNSNSYTVGGAGPLTLQTSSGSAVVNVLSGAHTIALPLSLASNTNFNVSAGARLVISGPLTIEPGISLAPIGSGSVTYNSSITVGSGGALTISNSTAATSLTLQGTAKTTVVNSSSGITVLQLGALSLAGAASTLDLESNDLIVHGGTLSSITTEVGTGYAKGTWNGPGIQSSSAAADAAHLTALAVAAYGDGTGITSIDGTALSPGDVVVKYTYYGDTNLDGVVNGSDYSRIDAAYLKDRITPGTDVGWSNGDFNYDNVIDGSDYTLIDNAFNMQGASLASELAVPTEQIAVSSASGAVPEPTLLGIAGVTGSILLGRRRRRK